MTVPCRVAMASPLSQTFAFMLQLPPVPIRMLESALMPGPLPLRGPDGTPRVGDDGGVLYDTCTLVDPDYIASAALLRDLHAGLLRMVDGHAPRKQELPHEASTAFAGLAAETTPTDRYHPLAPLPHSAVLKTPGALPPKKRAALPCGIASVLSLGVRAELSSSCENVALNAWFPAVCSLSSWRTKPRRRTGWNAQLQPLTAPRMKSWEPKRRCAGSVSA
jgi:hypothetical protein